MSEAEVEVLNVLKASCNRDRGSFLGMYKMIRGSHMRDSESKKVPEAPVWICANIVQTNDEETKPLPVGPHTFSD